MKHLLLILPFLFGNLHAQEPTFTTRVCAETDSNSKPVQYCHATSYGTGALMTGTDPSCEELCQKAAARISGFCYAGGRNFGRFSFKVITVFDDPEEHNALRCVGTPRDYFLKKIGPNSYQVYYQAA